MPDSIEYLRAQFDGLLPQEQIAVWGGIGPTAHIEPQNIFRRHASELIREQALRALKPDVVHTASLFEGLADNVVGRIRPNSPFLNAVTLYDLIPLAHRETYLAHEPVERWYVEKLASLERADQLLGISRYSCDEAAELLSIPAERLTDISGAADDIFRRLAGADAFRRALMNRYGVTKPFVMYAGGFDSRKNIASLIRAFAGLPTALREAHQLVIVGGAPAPEREALHHVANQAGLTSADVLFAGYVPDDDLVRLYNLCALYAFPSLQEGFGLPALEAMSSGAVVIGSNTSSLPEVIGFPDALFDPSDEAAIGAKMAMALTDQEFRERFLEHGKTQALKFSWNESARRALESLEEAYERTSALELAPAKAAAPSGKAKRAGLVPAPGGSVAQVMTGATTYGDKDGKAVRARRPLSNLTKDAASLDRIVIEVTDHPYCAKSLRMAAALPTDIVVTSPAIGKPLAALAQDSEGRRLLAGLLYRWGGYPALMRAVKEQFAADCLASELPPSALDMLGHSQVTGLHGMPEPAVGWRTRATNFASKVLALEGAATASATDWAQIAKSFSWTEAREARPVTWHVDISNLAIRDAGTGIQRVVRHVLDELMARPPEGCRVEAIHLGDDGIFRYARDYSRKRYLAGEPFLPDEVVEFSPKDIYLGLDLVAHLIPAYIERYRSLRNRGVEIHFVLYDLLPLLRPDCFEPHLLPLFRRWYEAISEVADGVLCISKAVADEFEQWLHQSRPDRCRPLGIGWFHLGADLAVATTTKAQSRLEDATLLEIDASPTFLMVGTVEPRKGHAQSLDAFERLWADGIDANLLIIGKPGWLVEDLIDRLRTHPMRGKRLFWFDKAGDDLLLAAYHRASALLMPSEGEGFGLPLIEAAHHGVPLIARDLPVFREIAGEHAHYFRGHEGASLQQALEQWLELHAKGKAPASGDMPWLTWSECAAQLVDVVAQRRWVHRWMPSSIRSFGAFDYRFRTQVGTLARGRLRASGEPGLLLYGPYVPLSAGQYTIEVEGAGAGLSWMDACSGKGSRVHAHRNLTGTAEGGQHGVHMELNLHANVTDLEIRIGVDAGSDFELARIVVRPRELEAESAATPA